MGKVNPDEHGTARPKVEPDDLEEDVAVFTIADYSEMEVDDASAESGKRLSGCLTFQETGEKVVWCNKTAIVALCHYYGNESEDWEGQLCPVEKVQGKAFGKSYHKVNVVPVDDWPEYIDGLKPQKAAARKSVRKAARKPAKSAKRKGAKRGGRGGRK